MFLMGASPLFVGLGLVLYFCDCASIPMLLNFFVTCESQIKMSLVNKILKRAHGRRPVSCAPSVPSMSRGVHVPRSVASSAPSTGRGTKRHGIASDLSNTTVSSDVNTCDSTTLAHPIDVGEMLAQGHDVDIPTQLFIKSGVRKVRNKFQRNVFKSRLRPNRDTAIALTGVDLHAAVLNLLWQAYKV